MIPGGRRRPSAVGRCVMLAMVVLARGEAELASWPLARAGGADLGVVDDLARLALAARRVGCSVRLCHARGELLELLELVGLGGLLLGVDEGGRG